MENTAEKLEQEVQIDENHEQTKEQQISLFTDPVEIEVVDDTPEQTETDQKEIRKY